VVRRRVREPTALTAYVVCAPHESALEAVGRVAGRRWTVERCLEAAQGEVGLEQYAVRRWTGWYRHIPWAMGAYALLTVRRAAHLPPGEPNKTLRPPTPGSLAACKARRGLVCR
jgi:SRSO17 transposase